MVNIDAKLKEFIVHPDKSTVLSTSNKAGEVNIAMFGSFMMPDDATILLMLGDNRSYMNLTENSNAALLVVIPGKGGMETEGCRVYLKVRKIQDDGDVFNQIKGAIREQIGEMANILNHLINFEILNIRPIVEIGG